MGYRYCRDEVGIRRELSEIVVVWGQGGCGPRENRPGPREEVRQEGERPHVQWAVGWEEESYWVDQETWSRGVRPACWRWGVE